MLIGDYRIEIVPDTEFRLDGGAMFGVVPRVLWERLCPPDELNRISLQMNCLFVDTGKEKILIETGIGEKWSKKETEIYGIFREKTFAETLFEKTGARTEDISIVINTHLHFDHAGGNTTISNLGFRISDLPESGIPNFDKAQSAKIAERIAKAQFPNARYFISESELKAAENPHERDKASYISENWRPLIESGQLETKQDNYEAVKGLEIEQIRGHSATMQTWKLSRGGETLYGFADLIPTTAHLSLPWIMGYDLFPTETLEFKKTILPLAVKENWMCLFYHDREIPFAHICERNGKVEISRIL